MKRYEVLVKFGYGQLFEIYANDSYDAAEKAYEEAAIYLNESHQYADSITVLDVYDPEEEE